MDVWTFVADWWQRFGAERILHATAHDVLMAAPGLGDYFRQVGVIPASRQGVSVALSAGCDVIIWPGGEVDAMRNWRRRDEAVLGGRHGFVRQALTVHRAQGSEWPAVVAVFPAEATGMLSRPLVYTALTRAQQHLSVVHGAGPALARAVRTIGERPRETRLAALLTDG